MSIYMGVCWKCEGCNSIDNHNNKPWNCPNCGKEVCQNCFWVYGLCKKCSVGKADEECKLLSKRTDWDE